MINVGLGGSSASAFPRLPSIDVNAPSLNPLAFLARSMVEQKSVAKVAPLKTEVAKDVSKSSLSRNDSAMRTFKVDYDWIENTS